IKMSPPWTSLLLRLCRFVGQSISRINFASRWSCLDYDIAPCSTFGGVVNRKLLASSFLYCDPSCEA
ncbi:hypothetical protein, partial [Bacillus cereus]|uniref:hypothetical protein n=1 Tax=Bacillus cereus TaxID=1396 RepID=UPI0034D464D0